MKQKPHDKAAEALIADYKVQQGGGTLRAKRGTLRRTTIALPAQALKDLKMMAIEADLPLNAVMLAALDAFLQRAQKPPIVGVDAKIDELLASIGCDRPS